MEYNNPNDYWRRYRRDQKHKDSDSLKASLVWLVAIAEIFLLLIMSGCKTTKYVPVIEQHTDTLIERQTVKDSVYLHDSIYVSQWQQGDTVRIETERWHTSYRDRWRTDTVYQSKRDSIPYPVEVIREVARKPTAMERLLIIVGIMAIICALVWAVSKIKLQLPQD